MRFMLMLYADERAGAAIAPETMAKVMQTMHAYQEALTKAGAFIETAALARTPDARTIRMVGGEVKANRGTGGGSETANVFVADGGDLQVFDGPYAETREQFGGYFIIEVEDMDAALKWAARCPAAQWGPIEVRPYHPGF